MPSPTPNTASEQTPLLTPSWGTASRAFNSAKIQKWAISGIDTLVFVPFMPGDIAIHVLKNAFIGGSPVGVIIILATIITITLGFLLAFGPTLVFCVAWFLSYWVLSRLRFLYKYHGSRITVRIAVVALIAWSLWDCVDLRREWTPLDLPPLNDPSSSIRLLDVKPAGVRWRIEGNLRTVQLKDNPAYEALSYEWGNPRKTHSISLDNKRFGVTENLWKALHNVRQATETRTLWVDAICIDQMSVDEKNSQVHLMTLIYQRARNVLVSLGKHVPPRWVESSDPSTWNQGWALQTANAYWESTHYWLEQLALEEYWKRCWIVQELGYSFSITVYAGGQPIPWTEFTNLVSLFAQKSPDSPLPRRILRFDDLRRALYHDGETYVLSQLLDSFRDSFCSVSLDKILAFTGMAVDCRGGCVPINYGGGVKALYESIISFQNSSANHNDDGGIEMVYFAALVRRLLSRQHQKVEERYAKLGWIYQPESWSYYWCGDDAMEYCLMAPEIFLLFPVLEYLRAPFSASKPMSVQSSIWLPAVAEVQEIWIPETEQNLADIKVIGAITGEIQELGPMYDEYLRDPAVSQWWSARLLAKYPAELDQKRARGLNARLSALLGPAADFRISDVIPLPRGGKPREAPTAAVTGPRLFLGGEDIIMGLAPSNARVGDKLCQFWNSSAVAILRSRNDGNGNYEVVGRGAMLQIGEEVDWDVPTNKTMFLSGSPDSVELWLELSTLNHLSFDIVNLPGSLGLRQQKD